MSVLAPLFLYVGLAVAGAAVALHFIVTRQPPSSLLPTARFAPEGWVRVTTIARPTDLGLLALRVLLAIVAGAAFARPILVPDRRPIARVVLADVSGGVGDIAVVRDSARELLAAGDVLVIFDSAARVVRRGAADSASKLQRTDRQGALSTALIAALRSASQMRATADSIELAIVSPFRAVEVDGATRAIRALWPGRIRIVRVLAASDSMQRATGFVVRAEADDPVTVAASRVGGGAGAARDDAGLRIVRNTATDADAAWAEAGRHTLVRWPADGAPPGWIARQATDTVGAVVAGQTALVVPFERRWRVDPAASPPPTRIAARWVDGEPAAVERAVGGGCVRDVAIPVPTRGDVMLRPSFARLLEALAAPCTPSAGGPALSQGELDALAGTGPLAATAALPAPDTIATPLVPWLIALALVLALAELALRSPFSRRERGPGGEDMTLGRGDHGVRA